MAEMPGGEVVLYEAPDGDVRVDVRLEGETIWLSQRQMAHLFDTSTDNVGLHLKNIFDGGELVEAATTEDYSVVQAEGRRQVRRRVKHYGDGNKRIGTLLFLEYLRRNGLLLHADGSPRLADNAIVALALLIAESDPAQKELMVRLVLGLLEDEAWCASAASPDLSSSWPPSRGSRASGGRSGTAPRPPPASSRLSVTITEQVVLTLRLRDALARLNPQLPAEALDGAFRRLALPQSAGVPHAEALRIRGDSAFFHAVPGDEALRTIAQELVRAVRANVTMDWTLCEKVRARLRVLVKRILRRYGYPPDKQEKATETVLEQAALLSAEWAAA